MGEKPIEFVGPVVFQRWYFIKELKMRIMVETSETHYRDIGQPADKAWSGDKEVGTYLEFLWECEKIGSYQVKWSDTIAAFIAEWFRNFHLMWLLRRVRPNKPFTYVGQLLHPNELLGEKPKR